MILPEVLSAHDVEDVLVRVGLPVDRRNVGRALHQHPVEGVIAPGRCGQGWRVPKGALVDVVAACLCRRARRLSAPRRRPPVPACLYRLDAAELLMDAGDRELARLVPPPLRREVRQIQRVERQRAERQRRELERHRQEREDAARREAEAEAEAYRRKVAAERAFYAEILRKRERDEHEKVMEECYRVCFRTALKALWAAGMPTGPDWTEHPKAQQLRRDFPRERPSWWAPSPGLYEAVKADQALRLKFPYQEPDWSRMVPPYEPGRPWPWRQAEPDDADAGAD